MLRLFLFAAALILYIIYYATGQEKSALVFCANVCMGFGLVLTVLRWF